MPVLMSVLKFDSVLRGSAKTDLHSFSDRGSVVLTRPDNNMMLAYISK